MIAVKKMCSYRFSESFLSDLDKLGLLILKEERGTWSWAAPMTRTRAIQWAVRKALEHLRPSEKPKPKRKARSA